MVRSVRSAPRAPWERHIPGRAAADFAVDRAERLGWAAIVLAPGSKKPLAGSRGVHDATADPAILRERFAAAERRFGEPPNAGIATRASGLLVFDDDGKGDALDDVLADLGLSGSTFTVQTVRGRHVYYNVRGLDTSRLPSMHRGLEARHGSVYVMAPGSSRDDIPGGFIYEPVELDAPVLPATQEAIDELARTKPQRRRAKARPRVIASGNPTEALAAEHLPTAGESRHGAALALAHDALARGIDRAELDAETIAERFGPAGDHSFDAGEVERVIDHAYDGDRADVVDLVARVIENARGRTWRGSQVRVLTALLSVAVESGSPDFGCSTRRLAELAGCSRRTVDRASHDLVAAGLVERQGRTEAGAWLWRILEPSDASPTEPMTDPGSAPVGMEEDQTHRPTGAESGSLLARSNFPAAHDVFRHGALGATGHAIVVELAEHADDGLTVADLARAIGRSPKTIRNSHARRLVIFGLAERRTDGRLALTADTLADPLAQLDVAAAWCGSLGAGDRQRVRHERERRAASPPSRKESRG